MNRPIPYIRQQCPDTRRPDRDSVAEYFQPDQVNRNTSERRQQAIDCQQHPRRSVRINAKNLEHASHQIRIERWLPSGRPGVASIGIAETLSLSDRAGDAPHLPAKTEVIVLGARAVLAEGSNRR